MHKFVAIVGTNSDNSTNRKLLQFMQKHFADQATIASVKALWSVNSDYLDAALAEIKRQSGNMQHYLRTELKLTKTELADLRHLYLD